MPKTVSKEKKAVKVIKKMRTAPVLAASETITSKTATKAKNPKVILFVKVLLILAIGAVVFLLAQKYRGVFVAGTVNKSIISRIELNNKMAEKYGKQTLEEIISERLLEENLQKNKITVTDKEVSDELAKIKEQYGGEEQFKTAIAQYGMTEKQAEDSIKQSIGLKKLIEVSYKIEITDDQVSKYYEENKESYSGKKLEEVTNDIKDALYQQELYTKSQEWYSQIRKDAKVNSYL